MVTLHLKDGPTQYMCITHGLPRTDTGRCPVDGCEQSHSLEVPLRYTTAAEVFLGSNPPAHEALQVAVHLAAIRNEKG